MQRPVRRLCADPAPWAPLVEEAVGLSTLVPWAFVSGEAGVRKPQPEAFDAALAAVGRSASEVVFVDDSSANVDAAIALGVPAIRFEGADALRPELWKLLGLPV
jgi:FMN phosphatase YigB (HAD superfamily)